MFQTALIESGASGDRVPRLPLGVALALHGGAVLLVAAIALRRGDEIPDPPLPIRLVVAAVLPSPGGGGPARRISSRPAGAPGPRRVFVPAEQARPFPAPGTRPEDVESTGRELEGGSENAAPDGPIEDQGVGPVGPGGPRGGVSEGVTPIRDVGGDVRAPELVVRVDPRYPETARRAGVAGTVILEAIISAAGAVEDVRVVRQVHPLLDAEAARALESWRYRAATLNGRAVRVRLTVTVTFGLH